MTPFNQYLKDYFFENNTEISDFQLEAQKLLLDLPFPSIKQEAWKYTNLRTLAKSKLQKAILPTLGQRPDYIQVPEGAQLIVFVNGILADAWSNYDPTLVQILDTSNTDQAYSQLASADQYFNVLNDALPTQGIMIKLQPNQVIEQPIIVYKLTDASVPVLSQTKNLIIAEANAQATIIEIHKSLNNGEEIALHNEVNEIYCHQDAHLKYYKYQDEATNQVSINTTEVSQHAKSHFDAATITLGGGIIRNNLNVKIQGEHCETFMTGLSLLTGKTLVDNHTVADHQVPNCNSNEFYKGVYDEQSTGVFNGIVYVRQDAQKTNAFQQNRNILLTEEASIYTKPQLEIWADDVKCSHGATTGQLDDKALYYLRARGIAKDEAITLLLNAFANEITERLQDDFFSDFVKAEINKRLDK